MENLTEKQMKKIDSYLSGKNLKKFEEKIKTHPLVEWVGKDSNTGALILGFKNTDAEVYASPFFEGTKAILVDNDETQGKIDTNKSEFDNVEDFANWYYNHINDIHKIAFPAKVNKYKITVNKDYTITGEEHVLEVNTPEEVFNFLEGIGYETEEKEINDIVKNGGEYKGLNDIEFKVELIPVEEKEEKTPFNNPNLFVKEFKDYLIGKTLVINKDKVKISDVLVLDGNSGIEIEYSDDSLMIYTNDFKQLIDGEEISTDGSIVQLELQEEKQYNKPEYKYYVIQELTTSNVANKDNRKILSGFEYFEDAKKEIERIKNFGIKAHIEPKRDVESIFDLNDNSNWSINEHDWEIIRMALAERVKEKEFSEKEAERYFNAFKERGEGISYIKPSLILYLGKEQRDLKNAYMFSNLERIDDGCDISCRIQKELKRIIAMEKL